MTSKLVDNKRFATGLNDFGSATIVAAHDRTADREKLRRIQRDRLRLADLSGICVFAASVPVMFLARFILKGPDLLTFNDFLLWLIPPAVFLVGGALVAYLSHYSLRRR